MQRERLCGKVQLAVSSLVTSKKPTVGRFGVPVIEGEEMKRVGNIAKELSAVVVRILLEELDPSARRAIDSFKTGFTSWLDFELPEDYKHRCPIFRSRILAFQHHFIRGSLVC